MIFFQHHKEELIKQIVFQSTRPLWPTRGPRTPVRNHWSRTSHMVLMFGLQEGVQQNPVILENKQVFSLCLVRYIWSVLAAELVPSEKVFHFVFVVHTVCHVRPLFFIAVLSKLDQHSKQIGFLSLTDSSINWQHLASRNLFPGAALCVHILNIMCEWNMYAYWLGSANRGNEDKSHICLWVILRAFQITSA